MRLLKRFSSTFAIVILAVILVSLGALEFSQWRKRTQIQREIDEITKQQQAYQQKNQDLEDSLNLLSTKNYKDKVEREQLNLKKDGEIVINFPPPLPQPTAEPGAGQTNSQKWWHYFFGTN
jgi:cell division protein FtsB